MARRGYLFMVVAILVLTAVFVMADTRRVLIDGPLTAVNPQVNLVKNSAAELNFQVHLPGFITRDLELNGETWQMIDFARSSYHSYPGEPAVPMFVRWIAIPQGARPVIKVTASHARILENVYLAPAQPPAPDCYCEPDPAFEQDETLYSTNTLFPGTLYTTDNPMTLRGLRMVLLRIYPVQVNPVTHQAVLYSDLDVRIDFVGSKGKFFNQHRGRSYQALYNVALNKMAFANEPLPAPRGKSPNGAEFIILTAPQFADTVQDLADWKILQGYDTEVYTTDESGTTINQIKAWIQNAYDTWDPAPEFILFFGDAEFISPTYDDPYIGTDLYYVTVDGDDQWADIAYARISVDTVEQAQKRINDIIDYERNPIVDNDYYTNSWHAGYFQHSGGGYEERRFLRTSEETYQWFNQYMPESPFTPHRIYVTESIVNPRYWNQDMYLWNAEWWTYSTVDIVPELLRSNGFEWNGGASDISAAVNAGTAFITHRDHGDIDGWSSPAFVNANVDALTNGDKLPVVWSINCLTGYFDDETGKAGNGKAGENFTERWERNPNGGAVGLIGSTRVSYSGINDRMFWGWLDALFPDFEPTYPADQANAPEWRMSIVLTYGMLYMWTFYSEDYYAIEGVEEFHWFGDPTMEMWAGVPQDLTVSHLPIIPMGATSFAVEVNVDGALISLVQNGVILGRAYSAGGTAEVMFDGPITDMEDVHLTISRHQYRPYEADLMVGAISDGIIDLNKGAYSETSTVTLMVADIDLSGQGTYTLHINSETETAGENVVCTEFPGTGTFVGTINLTTNGPAKANGVLSVADGDVITLFYHDADNGTGSPEDKTDTAYADTAPPTFGGAQSATGGDTIVNLTWNAATDLTPPITYQIYRATESGGQNFDVPVATTSQTAFTDTGLINLVYYYYVVRATDYFNHQDTNTAEVNARTIGPVLFWQEDFDDKAGVPEDWEIVNGGDTGCTWSDENPGGRSNDNWNGTFIIADAAYCGQFKAWDDQIITSTIDCKGYTGVHLLFTDFYGLSSGIFPSHAIIDVSNDDGATWHNVANWAWDSHEGVENVNIGQWADQKSDVKLRFTYQAGNFGDAWGLDNLQLTGTPNNDPPTADFNASTTQGPAPLTVEFTAVTTGVVDTVLWDFGDGATSTDLNPSHIYTSPGAFTVSFSVTGPQGSDVESKEDYITVSCAVPVIDFEADVTEGDLPLEVHFSDLSTYSAECPPTLIEWKFGDLTPMSNEHDPTHVYETLGNFTVSLTYTTDYGDKKYTETKEGYIAVSCGAPVADFEADLTEGEAPLTVHFTDLSTAAEGCEITGWSWAFGMDIANPAFTSTEQNPLVTFSQPGVYAASLTVTNDAGETVETKTQYIVVNEPGTEDDDTVDDDSTGDDDAGDDDASDDDAADDDDNGGGDDDDSGGCGC